MKINKGIIKGFSGSWGSGIATLTIQDCKTGKMQSVHCDNSCTVRALQSAFGDTIAEGHTVNPKGAYIDQVIFWEMDEMGLCMAGFIPEEEAGADIFEKYEKQFEKEKTKITIYEVGKDTSDDFNFIDVSIRYKKNAFNFKRIQAIPEKIYFAQNDEAKYFFELHKNFVKETRLYYDVPETGKNSEITFYVFFIGFKCGGS